MPHEALAPLEKLEEVEPDPYDNPDNPGFSSTVAGTNPEVEYGIVEAQLPMAERPVNDENQRTFLVRQAGKRVLGLALVLREDALVLQDKEEDENDLLVRAEIRVERPLADPVDARLIVDHVIKKYALPPESVTIDETDIAGLPKAAQAIREVMVEDPETVRPEYELAA